MHDKVDHWLSTEFGDTEKWTQNFSFKNSFKMEPEYDDLNINFAPKVERFNDTKTNTPMLVGTMPNFDEGGTEDITLRDQTNCEAVFETYEDSCLVDGKKCKEDYKELYKPRVQVHYPCSLWIEMLPRDRKNFETEMELLIGSEWRKYFAFEFQESKVFLIRFKDRRFFWFFLRRYSKNIHPMNPEYALLGTELVNMKCIINDISDLDDQGNKQRVLKVIYNRNLDTTMMLKELDRMNHENNVKKTINWLNAVKRKEKDPEILERMDMTRDIFLAEPNYVGNGFRNYRNKYVEFDTNYVSEFDAKVKGYNSSKVSLDIRNCIDQKVEESLNNPDRMRDRLAKKGYGKRVGVNFMPYNKNKSSGKIMDFQPNGQKVQNERFQKPEKYKLNERKEIRTFSQKGSRFKEAASSCSSLNIGQMQIREFDEIPSEGSSEPESENSIPSHLQITQATANQKVVSNLEQHLEKNKIELKIKEQKIQALQKQIHDQQAKEILEKSGESEKPDDVIDEPAGQPEKPIPDLSKTPKVIESESDENISADEEETISEKSVKSKKDQAEKPDQKIDADINKDRLYKFKGNIEALIPRFDVIDKTVGLDIMAENLTQKQNQIEALKQLDYVVKKLAELEKKPNEEILKEFLKEKLMPDRINTSRIKEMRKKLDEMSEFEEIMGLARDIFEAPLKLKNRKSTSLSDCQTPSRQRTFSRSSGIKRNSSPNEARFKMQKKVNRKGS